MKWKIIDLSTAALSNELWHDAMALYDDGEGDGAQAKDATSHVLAILTCPQTAMDGTRPRAAPRIAPRGANRAGKISDLESAAALHCDDSSALMMHALMMRASCVCLRKLYM